MVNVLSDIGRQRLTEEALVAANQIIASQAEQIAVLTQSVALLTTKIEELQPGHEGVTRTYKEEPEKIVELNPIEGACDKCGGTIIVEDKTCSVRQVIEVDKPQTIVIEYRLYRGICESCGKVFSPELLAGFRSAAGSKAFAMVSL